MSIYYFHLCKVITLVENYILKLKPLLKKSEYLSTSFKRLKTNHIQVKAYINGVKGMFIIDTGASNSCIDLKLYDLYNIRYQKSSEKASSATDQISNTMISKKNHIKIGKWFKKTKKRRFCC